MGTEAETGHPHPPPEAFASCLLREPAVPMSTLKCPSNAAPGGSPCWLLPLSRHPVAHLLFFVFFW